MIEIHALTEPYRCMLAVLTPQTIGFPGVYITIRIESRDNDEVEVLKHAGDEWHFSKACDQSVGDVVGGAGTNPFTGVKASSNQDGPTSRRFWVVVVGGVYTNAKSRDIPALSTLSDVDQAHVGSEKRGKKAHPRLNHAHRLIIGKEDVGLGALRVGCRAHWSLIVEG